jgi:uncharacterized phage protein (TIGR01671 family)
MNKNHYKFFCTAANSFIEQYKYNGYVDELFDDPLLIPCQCTGVKDSYEKYIYENDVIEFERVLTSNDIKKYSAFITFYDGAFLVLSKDNEDTLVHMWLHDLCGKKIYDWKVKVIGNKLEKTNE